jgi:hypothetical protein
VLGRGGVPAPPEGPVAAGVIGLAGAVPIPNISETGNTGVYGSGPTGVFGRGDGPGIHGLANRDRGGIFESGERGAEPIAQLRLVPLPPDTTVASRNVACPATFSSVRSSGGIRNLSLRFGSA